MTMTAREATMQTDLPLPGKRQGKVRDIYEATTSKGQEALVMIATDRMSAFDVVLPNGVPSKGLLLSRMSAFWFQQTAHIIPNHLLGLADELIETMPQLAVVPLDLARRAMVDEH